MDVSASNKTFRSKVLKYLIKFNLKGSNDHSCKMKPCFKSLKNLKWSNDVMAYALASSIRVPIFHCFWLIRMSYYSGKSNCQSRMDVFLFVKLLISCFTIYQWLESKKYKLGRALLLSPNVSCLLFKRTIKLHKNWVLPFTCTSLSHSKVLKDKGLCFIVFFFIILVWVC